MSLTKACACLLALTASAHADVPNVIGVTATATTTAKSRDAAFVLGSDPTKMWCEGKGDEGVGEQLTLRLAAPTRVESITLRAGAWQSPELFRTHNRITELRVVTDDGKDQTVKLREEREDVEVKIGRTVGEIRLEIAAVAKGKINDTCISGVDFHTDPSATAVPGLDKDAQDSLGPAFTKVWNALATCDVKGLVTQLKWPFVAAGHRYNDIQSFRKACKDPVFAAYTAGDPPLHVKSLGAASLMFASDKLEWHLVYAGKAWRLAKLVDLGK